MTLVYLSTAWLIGIGAARYVNLSLELMGLRAVLAITGLVLWRDHRGMRQVPASGLLLFLRSAGHTFSLPDPSDPNHIAAYRDHGPVALWGRVVHEPDVRDSCTNLRLAVDRVQIEEEEHQARSKVPARAPHYPAHMYVDERDSETPPVFRELSCRDYLARRGIHGMIG